MPEVSVIIPTFNRCHLLPRAVASAKTAGTDVEIVVVNNGSTDGTDEVCKTLEGIHYVRLERNAGPGGGRNAGIEASSAPFLAFLDDDDKRLPDSLDWQVGALKANPEAGFAYGRALRADENCDPVGITDPSECPEGDIFWWLVKSPIVPCVSLMVRRTCLAVAGLFDPGLFCGDDWDLLLRLAERFPAIALERPVGIYRSPNVSANNTTSNLSLAYRTTLSIQSRALSGDRARSAPRRLRREARRQLLNRSSDILILTAAEAIEVGRRDVGRKNLLEAIRLNPYRALRPWTLKLMSQSLIT